MTVDPFATLSQTDIADAVGDDVDLVSFFKAEMVIGEEEFEQPEAYRPYTPPKDKSWVPVEIISAKVDTRLMDVLVPDADGKDVSAKIDVDQFRLECQHMSTAYGDKGRPYLLSVPVFDVKLPKKNGQTWTKVSGRKLLAATGVTTPGQAITPDILESLAEKMIGKHILAQIRLVPKDYTDITPRQNPDGTFVKAKVDEDEEFVRIIRDVNGQLVWEKSSDVWAFGEDRLIRKNPSDDSVFLIPDSDGNMVKDTVTRTVIFDNLQDDVAPVPGTMKQKKLAGGGTAKIPTGDRCIEVSRTDDSEVLGEVTWETVGQLATRDRKIGTPVTVAIAKTGEELAVTWNGTAWIEAVNNIIQDTFSG